MSTKTLPILDISPLLEPMITPNLSEAQTPTSPQPSSTPNTAAPTTTTHELDQIVADLYDACTNVGFFYIKTPFPELPQLIAQMEKYSHIFFNKDLSIKKRIDMTTVGPAWRGFFSVGDEFTSGAPDIKEGIYFGAELSENDPRVIAQVPMNGANVFPRTGPLITTPIDADDSDVAAQGDDHRENKGKQHESFHYAELEEDKVLKTTVLRYLDYAAKIGFAIIDGLSLALNLPRYALRNILFTDMVDGQLGESLAGRNAMDVAAAMAQIGQLQDPSKYDPLQLFRIFNYPSTKKYQQQYNERGYITPVVEPEATEAPVSTTATTTRTIYSVAEHTDYGCVTILYQDASGGLEVRDIKSGEFIAAPPLENTLVINIGDALEKMTNGLFVSTPHRVLNKRDGDRISFPFFFDPSFKANLMSLVPLSPKLQEVFAEQQQQQTAVYTHNSKYKRWDGKEVGLQGFSGTYGNYILEKVSKVFPQLAQQVELDPNQKIKLK